MKQFKPEIEQKFSRYSTAKELRARMNIYFKSCSSKKRINLFSRDGHINETYRLGRNKFWVSPISMEGLASALEISVDKLNAYEEMQNFSLTVSRAKSVIEYYLEEGMLTRRIKFSIAKKALKKHFGWNKK